MKYDNRTCNWNDRNGDSYRGALTSLDELHRLPSLTCIPEESNEYDDFDEQENMYTWSRSGMQRNRVSFQCLTSISQESAECNLEVRTSANALESIVPTQSMLPLSSQQQHSTSIWSSVQPQDDDDDSWGFDYSDDEKEVGEIQPKRVADYDVLFVTNQKCGNGRSFNCNRKVAIIKVTNATASFE